jgi:hypothetical protein
MMPQAMVRQRYRRNTAIAVAAAVLLLWTVFPFVWTC